MKRKIKISTLDEGISPELIYQDIDIVKQVQKEYKVNGDKELRDTLLESLATDFVEGARYTSYRYLVHKTDLSLDNNEGITYFNAVKTWGFRALNLLDEDELTEYMSHKVAGSRLLNYIIDEAEDLEMLTYILESDTNRTRASDKPKSNEVYEGALYTALLKCEEAEQSMHILSTLVDNVAYKGKTLKNIMIDTFEDKDIIEPVSQFCYGIVVDALYRSNPGSHKFYHAFMGEILEIAGTDSVIQYKCMYNALKAGMFKILHREREVLADYLTQAAVYPIFNKIIARVIALKLRQEENETEADITERNEFRNLGVALVTDSLKSGNSGLYNAFIKEASHKRNRNNDDVFILMIQLEVEREILKRL